MPTENWPPHEQQQLGGALSQLNATLLQRVSEIQGHNLGECTAGLWVRALQACVVLGLQCFGAVAWPACHDPLFPRPACTRVVQA